MNEWSNVTLEQKMQSLETATNFITSACMEGNLENVRTLYAATVERFDLTSDSIEVRRLKTYSLEKAAEYGRTRCLQYLLSLDHFGPTDKTVETAAAKALEKAATKGYWDCMEVLIPHAPAKSLGKAMTMAAYTNHWTCVQHILPLVDPTDQENFEVCLLWSSAHKQPQFLAEFYSRCNPEAALEYARGNHPGLEPRWTEDEMQMLVEYHGSLAQRERLVQHVGDFEKSNARKSKI